MLRWLTVIIVSGIAGATAIALILLSLGVIVGPGARAALDVSYADFLAVTLTAVTVVLAALAVGIAIIAMRSFHEIKEDARRSAVDTVNKIASTEISICLETMMKDGNLDTIFERMSMASNSMNITAQRELGQNFDPGNLEDR